MDLNFIREAVETVLKGHPVFDDPSKFGFHKFPDGNLCINFHGAPHFKNNKRNEDYYGFSLNLIGDILYILEVYLRPDQRGKGYGNAFYNAMIELGKKLEVTRVEQTPSGWTPSGESRKDYLIRHGWSPDGIVVYQEMK